jgi:hypothetical protein
MKGFVMVKKSQAKKPVGKYRHGLDDNIKMRLREIGYECVGWIHGLEGKVQCWNFE